MKKLALTAAAALLLAACGQQATKTTADEIRDALPSGDALKIDAPDTTKTTTAAPERLAVQRSDFAAISYAFATNLNVGVYGVLLQLQLITLYPATSCVEGVSCTWGPGLGDDGLNMFRLVVTKRDDGGFDYALSGAPVSTGGTRWIDFIAGTAYPGNKPGHGYGSFGVFFDAVAAGLDHPAGWTQSDFGTLRVRYDARPGLAIECAFMNARNGDDPGLDPANPNRVDVYYDFNGGEAGGDLQLAWRTLPVDATTRSISLHTRWHSTGSGRADAQVIVPELVDPYLESECWAGQDAQFVLTYDTNPQIGLESTCSFGSADFLPFPDPFPPL